MPASLSQVTIPNTELHALNSSIVKQEFNIFIALPDTYAKDSMSSCHSRLRFVQSRFQSPIQGNEDTICSLHGLRRHAKGLSRFILCFQRFVLQYFCSFPSRYF